MKHLHHHPANKARVSHWTRQQVSQIEADDAIDFPHFDPQQVKVLMPGYDVWDNWYALDENNQIADVQGFRVLVALAAPSDSFDETNLYYFYSRDGLHYQAGGKVFTTPLESGIQEWSGSTLLRNDGALQTFYTVVKESGDYSGRSHRSRQGSQGMPPAGMSAQGSQAAGPQGSSQSQMPGQGQMGAVQNDQRLATAIQDVVIAGNRLSLAEPRYHAILAVPDGQYYQTMTQASERETLFPTSSTTGSTQSNNFCFRDPHFFKDPSDGRSYLLFEANTGNAICPEGSVRREYIGSASFEPDYVPTPDELKANGCIGIAELTNEGYTAARFLPPLLTSNLVTDEIERVNMLKIKDDYYLFCIGRVSKMAMSCEALERSTFMLGFRSRSLFGPYTPLNRHGVVLRQQSFSSDMMNSSDTQSVYSYLLQPDLTVLTYAQYSTDADGNLQKNRSAGPTLSLHIKGNRSYVGEVIYNILPA
ncbi:glycoside hydrolase family 68 protein [Zymobacter palmae]|uniref:levansucrase n=1 Tax=Zymobacter palmae TaxID=33074 RepID=A0A348HIH2_9GAMM|nr:glycoside hydrolase family 68 protein [Zymobacter palmae]BBG31424.1 beta-fructosidases [Zymobacter palmae]